jgi:hypothetical protein
LLFLLINKEVLIGLTNQALAQSQSKYKNYSCGMMLPNALALTRLQCATSSLIFSISILAVDALFRKIGMSLYFQISQETSIAREGKAFISFPLFWMASLHHAFIERIVVQF